MSYILDALRKIEHEKSRKSRPDGRVSISGDLFRERKRPAARGGAWRILLVIASASLVTFAGSWFLFQGKAKKSLSVIRNPAQPAPAPVNPPVATPAIAVHPLPVAVPPAAPTAAVAVTPEGAETVAAADSPAPGRRRPKMPINAQAPTLKQPAQAAQAPADIKLSGIAWQDERAARRAVINGFLLKEGAVVSGARITDIQADRVRFSSSAGQFEIRLDAVLPAEAPR